MSDYIQKPDFTQLVTTGSSLAFLWNNVSSDPVVKRDTRYKISGGRITGETSEDLRQQIKQAVITEDLVLLIAGGNDIFDRTTKKLRLKENRINEQGLLQQYNLLEEIKTFYVECIKLARENNTALIILSLFPRYFRENTKKELYLPEEKTFKKLNFRLRSFVESKIRQCYSENQKWIKVRFIDLTPFLLRNVGELFDKPLTNPHLSLQGKYKIVEKLKEIIEEVFSTGFVQKGTKVTRLLASVETHSEEQV